MGVYTEKFRALINNLPKSPDQFTNPMQASSVMAQLTNSVLQCMAALEEALEDAEKEKETLENMLMEKQEKSDGWQKSDRS
jgi:hypothetical protein